MKKEEFVVILMHKIGIIAGGGKLPLIIGKSLLDLEYEVVFFCIERYFKLNFYKKYHYKIIQINSITKIIKTLKKNNIHKIILAGNINRPSIKDINFEIDTLKLIRNLALEKKGDDRLLLAISKIFQRNGIFIFNWKKKCKDIFINEENLTLKTPSRPSILNKNKGLEIFKKIGRTDISQSLILQNKLVLGIEAAEGTDELIKRCYKYKKKGDKGILIKLTKYNQNPILDIPTIGIKTVQFLKKYDYEGVFLEKNKCIIIDKDKVTKFCDTNNIFISSVIKN